MSKLDLESTELSVGGVKLKGVYIAVVLSFASTIAGGIFAASKFINRIDNLESKVAAIKMPDGEPVVKLIENVDFQGSEIKKLSEKNTELTDKVGKQELALKELNTQISANDVSKLQGTIATIKTSMENITGLAKDVQFSREKLIGLERDMQSLKKDVDSQWNAIDSIGAGSLKGK